MLRDERTGMFKVQRDKAMQQLCVAFSQEIRQNIYAMAVSIGKGSAPRKINTSILTVMVLTPSELPFPFCVVARKGKPKT